ncbi:disulfide bond formation protein B [Paucibacter sp. APW11]|uniref:Disulfide bond formation protein B n=1 Tax=Roseateles aquae TaxID=3077235 RepID=A0ABU3P975_9BURK|nr:disulfide bond formation protein B [Paucibacter sp. APW11]MDT8999104.1 disulfide bond formation protein B [Paucibacter sp. APW11]
MFLQPSKLPAQTLAITCLASFAALTAALVAQHAFGVRPCAWCVLQRGVFLLLGVVAGLGWLLKRNTSLRSVFLALSAALGLSGFAAAYYQWTVASKLVSCDMTLADRIVTALDLETLLPKVFMITGSCADADKYRLIGLPYEVWSGLLFAGLTVLALLAVRKR